MRQAAAKLGEIGVEWRTGAPTAVAEPRAAALTVRDAAQLLGVTPSRISHIEEQDHLANRAERPHRYRYPLEAGQP